ncbi:MAG: TrkA family potassium uptake protein [Chloroflexi bacterium]|nr:TrkA family potassium uptake protein [Chloroflexota bacterium]
MYVVVVGGGKVGYYLTKTLIGEGHEVLLIEKDKKKCEALVHSLGSVVVRGDGCEASTLTEVGTGRADVVVAVTGDDEDNLIVCQMAKKRFNVPRAIARINNPKNERIFKILGIDVTISSTDIIMSQIEQELPAHSFTHLLTLRGAGLEIVETQVTPESRLAGRALRDSALPGECAISLVLRDGKPIIPTGNLILESGDLVIAVTSRGSEDELQSLFRGKV